VLWTVLQLYGVLRAISVHLDLRGRARNVAAPSFLPGVDRQRGILFRPRPSGIRRRPLGTLQHLGGLLAVRQYRGFLLDYSDIGGGRGDLHRSVRLCIWCTKSVRQISLLFLC